MNSKLFNILSHNLNIQTKKVILKILLRLHKLLFPNNIFYFNSKKYEYFYNIYNMTFTNERAVEVPVALKYLKKYKGKDILEIGNVLSHYIKANHTILDKYEEAKNVINKDIISYIPKNKYDLIISISTIEHIGKDEKIKDKNKSIKSIVKIKSMLSKKGVALITFLQGYNKYLDKFIAENINTFSYIYYLKQSKFGNKWIQVNSINKNDKKILIIGVIKNLNI